MKARIKKTGEIINIANYAKVTLDQCCGIMQVLVLIETRLRAYDMWAYVSNLIPDRKGGKE